MPRCTIHNSLRVNDKLLNSNQKKVDVSLSFFSLLERLANFMYFRNKDSKLRDFSDLVAEDVVRCAEFICKYLSLFFFYPRVRLYNGLYSSTDLTEMIHNFRRKCERCVGGMLRRAL